MLHGGSRSRAMPLEEGLRQGIESHSAGFVWNEIAWNE
jgi:hypothetical protein